MGLREDILEVEEKIEDLEKSTSYIHSLPYEMLQDMKKENKILYIANIIQLIAIVGMFVAFIMTR